MKKAGIQTVVSIAEIISSLAIVASLIYVAYEFNRSEILTNRDAENIIYQRVLELERLIIENSDLAKIIVKTSENANTLSPEERLQYLAYEHIFYDSWETLWAYHQEDILEHEVWEGWNYWFIEESKRKPLLGWIGNRKNFSGEFLDYVDNLLRVELKENLAK